MRDGGWVDLDNVRTTLSLGGVAGRARRHRRRPHPAATGMPRWPVARRRRPRVTIGVTHAPYQRVLDPMAADGAAPADRRAHPRRPAGPAVLRRAGHQLRPADRRAPRAVSRWWPGAGLGARRRAGAGRRRLAARVGRARHVALRAGAVRLPPRGDPADPRPRADSRSTPRHPAHPAKTCGCAHDPGDVSRQIGLVAPRVARCGAGPRGRRTRHTDWEPCRVRWAILHCRCSRRTGVGGDCHGVWRSLVARFVRDEEAAGSNPVTPTAQGRTASAAPAFVMLWEPIRLSPRRRGYAAIGRPHQKDRSPRPGSRPVAPGESARDRECPP